jgi:hypothetical protein
MPMAFPCELGKSIGEDVTYDSRKLRKAYMELKRRYYVAGQYGRMDPGWSGMGTSPLRLGSIITSIQCKKKSKI